MHTYKSCSKAQSILILGDWRTEIKPQRKSNPRGWVVTTDKNIILNPNNDDLIYFPKSARLIYSKDRMEFNHQEGNGLLFDREGCFILEPRGR